MLHLVKEVKVVLEILVVDMEVVLAALTVLVTEEMGNFSGLGGFGGSCGGDEYGGREIITMDLEMVVVMEEVALVTLEEA